jgi:hypothetical protein
MSILSLFDYSYFIGIKIEKGKARVVNNVLEGNVFSGMDVYTG